MNALNDVVITAALRTPMGGFGGQLSALTAVELGVAAVKALLDRTGLDPAQVQELYMGNVCPANLGQAPARQVALGAGLPPETTCTLINKVCASGAKAVMLAAQSIQLGLAEVVIAGGMESMSNVPYYIPKARFGYKYGGGELIDGLEKDGLLDVYDRQSMGIYSDQTAERYGLSREVMDDFTIQSYQRAAQATESGAFRQEIIPVSIPQKKGEPLVIREDEEFRKVNFDKLKTLKAAFSEQGTTTAASSSPISDGASALLLMSRRKAEALGLKPLARIMAFADAEQEPAWFTTTPAIAVPKALERAGLSADAVDLFEVNEAFASVPLAFSRILGVSEEKINVNGGAVSLGHPLGCSGARILTTLTHALHTHGGRYGAIGICNGGGGASAIVIEKL